MDTAQSTKPNDVPRLTGSELSEICDSAVKILFIDSEIQAANLNKKIEVPPLIEELAQKTYDINPDGVKNILLKKFSFKSVKAMPDDFIRKICIEKLKVAYSLAALYKISDRNN